MSRTRSPLARVSAAAFLLAFVLDVGPSLPAWGHGEEIEIGNGAPRGPVSLTPDQAKAVGIEVARADLRPIALLLGVNGEVATLPNAQADVSLRISGTVRAIYVNLGDQVRAGEKLALIESRAIANPPPSIVVSAPAAGVIDARNITVGQSVDPNSTLFHLSNREHMRVIGKVYEEDLGKVHLGQSAFVKLLAYPNRLLEGVVRFVAPTLDPVTRTVDMWIVLDNKEGLLKPNLFAHADIVLGKNPAALAVPNAAVLQAAGEEFVFVRDGNRYDRVDITTGAADDHYTEVRSGLVPGDDVVTEGARELYTLWLTGGKGPAGDQD